MKATNIPMFRFTRDSSATTDAPPLGLVSGLLLVDSGEADNTFVLRCQDRYLTYSALSGIRPILFVINEEHWNYYRGLLQSHATRMKTISDRISIELPDILTPLVFPIDVEALTIHDGSFFQEQLFDPGIEGSLKRGELVLNQVSPTCARLVDEMNTLLSRYGFGFGADVTELGKIGCVALRWHNKAYYIRRTSHFRQHIPTHVSTALLSAREFLDLKTWQDLRRIARNGHSIGEGDEPRAIFVKSSFDSGGNVASRICEDNFKQECGRLRAEVAQRVLGQDLDERADVESLRADIAIAPSLERTAFSGEELAGFLECQRSRRNNISILVQEAIDRPATDENSFEGVGITCDISADEIDFLPAGQLYGDQDRRHYIGSYLGPELTAEDIPYTVRDQLRRLCSLAVEEGYRGPMNFDARLDSEGNWVFIYDCNPRLSAVYPPLATRRWLLEQGLTADSIVNLGYRGEYAGPRALEDLLQEFDEQGWLYTKERPRGVLPLPNLARRNGLDFVLANLERKAINEFVEMAANLRFDRTASTCVSAIY